MEEVLQYLGGIHKLSQPCIDDLKQLVEFKKFQKKHKILEIGQMNHNLLFIKKGLLYCYREDQVPKWFFWEQAMVVSIGAFYERRISKECIVAHTYTEAYCITRDQYEYLCETYVEFANIARVLLQKYLEIFEGYADILREHTPEERYQWVLENLPELLQRVPQKLAAPWLGMSPEHLSRLRGRRR